MTVETRYMRNALWDNKTYPSSYNIISGSLASGSLSNLQASDDVYMVFNKGADNNVEIEFSGTISGHIPFIQVDVEAHLSTSRTPSYVIEVAAYNWQTGAYETTGTMFRQTGIGTTDIHVYIYSLLGNKGKYVDANGNWKIKVKVVGDANLVNPALYIDYLCFRSVAFQLGTSQTTSYRSNDLDCQGGNVGIRVWGIKSDETEVEITSGVVAVVSVPYGQTVTLSATWNCPSTQQYVAFLVIVYLGTEPMKSADLGSGGLPFIFMTEDLNSALSSATWTVYYAFYYSATLDQTFFRFGTTTYNSRIANFTWGAVYTVSVSDSGIAADVLCKGVGVVKLDSGKGVERIVKALLKKYADTSKGTDAVRKLMAKVYGDSYRGADVGTKDLITCVSDEGVAVDISAKDFWKFLVDVGVGFDWFSKDVAPCLLDTSMSLDILLRGV